MSFAVLIEKMRDPNLAPLEKCVLLDLVCYDNLGEAYPSQSTLAKHHNVSARWIREVLKNLIKKGYIQSRRLPGKSNRYTVVEEVQFRSNTKPLRNQSSSPSRTTVPEELGTAIPTNSKSKNIHNMIEFKSCNKNQCENGYKLNTLDNTYYICECQILYEHRNR